MARKKDFAASTKPLSEADIRAGIDRLKRRIGEVRAFDPNTVMEQFDTPEVDRLSSSINDALVRTFGENTADYNRYRSAEEFNNGPFNYSFETNIAEVRQSLARSRNSSIAILESAVTSLEERLSELQSAANSPASVEPGEPSRKVFIVHGHDEGMREAVARFVAQIGFNPIILHEQPNKGRTIIEKVEANSDVRFAVVLLSPDDHGAENGAATRPRARQNVLLELGYFIGKLGRENVCALKRGEIELPSDFAGVVWEPYDAQGWKQSLAKELKAAGFQIDWNKVMD